MGIPDVTERKGYEPARVRFSCGHATLEYTESRGRGNEVDYFLKVETLWAADKRIAQEVRIPLTAEQYHSLKEQYENSEAEEKVFSLDGELEATVQSVQIN